MNTSQAKGKRAMKYICEYFEKIYNIELQRNLKHKSGDISIEVKNEESWDYRHFLNTESELSGRIKKYWNQCTRDAKLEKRKPLLIFTKAYHPFFIMLNNQKNLITRLKKYEINYTRIIKMNLILFILPDNPKVLEHIIDIGEPN